MATTYWDKVVCPDGSSIENIEWTNIINTPSGTKDIVGTTNQVHVDSTGVNTVLSLEPTIRITNIENVQTVSGTNYNTYADDTSDPGIQYFTRLTTYRSSTNVNAPIPVWRFNPADNRSHSIKISSVLYSGSSSATIERHFMLRTVSNATTISIGGMNIIGTSVVSGLTTSGTSPITFNIDLASLVTLTAPVNVTTRVEVLETLV